MKQETCILPTTAAVTTTSAVLDPVTQKPLNGVSADINTTEADKVYIYVSPALGAGETVSINLTDPAGNIVPADTQGLTPAAIVLNNTTQSVLVEGGFLYRLVKSGTLGATGVYYAFKPRQGG